MMSVDMFKDSYHVPPVSFFFLIPCICVLLKNSNLEGSFVISEFPFDQLEAEFFFFLMCFSVRGVPCAP